MPQSQLGTDSQKPTETKSPQNIDLTDNPQANETDTLSNDPIYVNADISNQNPTDVKISMPQPTSEQ